MSRMDGAGWWKKRAGGFWEDWIASSRYGAEEELEGRHVEGGEVMVKPPA